MERSKPTTRRLVEGVFVVAVLALVATVAALLVGSDDPTNAASSPVGLAEFDDDDVVTVPVVAGWVTSPTDADRRLAPAPLVDRPAGRTIAVDLDDDRQVWTGVGAALTDSSAELLDGNDAALDLLFDVDADDGARLNLVRLPLSATDFSTEEWTWEREPTTGAVVPGATARRSLDLLDEVAGRAGVDLSVSAVAWSASAEFADRVDTVGRSLRPGAEGAYADFLVEQAAWLVERGVPLGSLSLGNEPGHVSDYPTMLIGDDQLAALAREVAPELDGLGVDLLAVDHNWDDRDRVDAVVAAAPGAFDAAAFHCYSGEPSQMADLEIPAIVTECTGTTDTWSGTFAWDARQLIQGSIDSGSTGLMMWNLALDPQHGPKLDWGCPECRGLLTIDPDTGAIAPGPEFFVLAHLARAAEPGSTVLGTSTADDVATAAFRHGDGTIGVIGHNGSGESQVVEISLSDGRTMAIVVDADELFTVTL